MADAGDLPVEIEHLLNEPLLHLERLRGSGNNRLYRAVTRRVSYAVKAYPRQEEDPRDRLGAEFDGLSFLSRQGVAAVPRPIVANRVRRMAAYQWIEEATPVVADEAFIDAMVDLIAVLCRLSRLPDASALPRASASVFSPAESFAQLDSRFQRLASQARDPALGRFLRERVAPLRDWAIARAKSGLAAAGVDGDALLALDALVLSPSDFGAHNALAVPGGKFVFVDFEYFGWDDPVKMLSDALWHPGGGLSPSLRARLVSCASPLLVPFSGFATRFKYLHPIFGLCWCMILLNEYLPDFWQRRQAAGSARADRAEVLMKQLTKAQALIEQIEQSNDEYELS